MNIAPRPVTLVDLTSILKEAMYAITRVQGFAYPNDSRDERGGQPSVPIEEVKKAINGITAQVIRTLLSAGMDHRDLPEEVRDYASDVYRLPPLEKPKPTDVDPPIPAAEGDPDVMVWNAVQGHWEAFHGLLNMERMIESARSLTRLVGLGQSVLDDRIVKHAKRTSQAIDTWDAVVTSVVPTKNTPIVNLTEKQLPGALTLTTHLNAVGRMLAIVCRESVEATGSVTLKVEVPQGCIEVKHVFRSIKERG